ncbi:PIN-like domain-containing protein [Photobacterium leiognathi]|uniref:PIN-like domain-containing protein n=1 Tax=Photobacterium leiognathi TaxID=553611 RepID=UPI002981A681|nr:PIN domain-containing protein [Photobacterium leiognathi]
MKNIFPGHFKVKDIEGVWNNAHFIIDANVILNLYRYSDVTRQALEKALMANKDKLFITNQAAKEFLNNRLIVTSGQAKEYTTAIKSINDLLKSLSTKERHPFLEQEKLDSFNEVSGSVIEELEKKQKELLDKLSNDEILDFIEDVFEGKTGKPYTEKELVKIAEEGESRYESNIPPGYKDGKKNSSEDPYKKFGDLIVWKQTIDFAKSKKTPIVFITDDKKEDWWLEQSGRTIGPRPELVEEFIKETKQEFLMYTVDKFVQESASRKHKEVSADILTELQKFSEEPDTFLEDLLASFKSMPESKSTISVQQDVHLSGGNENHGKITVNLSHDMSYATGSGQFSPVLIDVPAMFEVDLVEYPSDGDNEFTYSSGCGTNRDFNVHLKARKGLLLSGNYVFSYRAACEETVQ